MSWTIPAASLNSASVPSDGSAIDLGNVRSSHGIEVVLDLTTANDTPQVWLEGSLDGVNWYSMNTPAGMPIYQVPSSQSAGTYIVLVMVANQPAQYVRATSDGPSGCATVTTLHTATA